MLEYASEVWDGCTQTDAYRLEQVQLIAARIVTGLPVFASLNSIFAETGWKTLAERRKTKKLTLMYKIVNNDAPSYLTDLLPSRVDVVSNYNLRNSQNFEISFARLCSLGRHFFHQLSDYGTALRNQYVMPLLCPCLKVILRNSHSGYTNFQLLRTDLMTLF